MVILDVKPWDDETDMQALEDAVLGIQMEGLVWGARKLVPIGYGIKKLQVTCVIEDDKVGVDDLSDQITGFEDYVQVRVAVVSLLPRQFGLPNLIVDFHSPSTLLLSTNCKMVKFPTLASPVSFILSHLLPLVHTNVICIPINSLLH